MRNQFFYVPREVVHPDGGAEEQASPLANLSFKRSFLEAGMFLDLHTLYLYHSATGGDQGKCFALALINVLACMKVTSTR